MLCTHFEVLNLERWSKVHLKYFDEKQRFRITFKSCKVKFVTCKNKDMFCFGLVALAAYQRRQCVSVEATSRSVVYILFCNFSTLIVYLVGRSNGERACSQRRRSLQSL